jgi:hypothetical protein
VQNGTGRRSRGLRAGGQDVLPEEAGGAAECLVGFVEDACERLKTSGR